MASATLSILIPLYNEEEFAGEILRRVAAAVLPNGLKREIIVVNDGSTDGSAEVVHNFMASRPEIDIKLLHLKKNTGKGAAIRMAIEQATGDFSIIQDADLEYDPAEYARMLRPLLDGRADVVYGSRFLVAGERRVLYYWHSLANQLLTTLCNIAADLNLTDMETCYKAFRTSLAKSIPLRSDRFGIEPELTVKFARRHARIFEVPISYNGRTYEEGKKIGLKDAFEAVWVILQARLTRKIYDGQGRAALDAMAGARRFNRWMADTILPWVGERVLEIGAGMGNMTRQICPGRQLYIATDLDTEYIEHLRAAFRHRKLIQIDRLDAANPDDFRLFRGQVDTVVCLNVLEHIEDHAGTLRNIRTLLEPDGRLILLVPNGPEAYGSIDAAIGHFRRYTRNGLEALLLENGYALDEMLEFNRISWPGWRFTGQVLKATTLSLAGMRMFDKFVWLWRKIDASLPWQPISIIAIARRTGDK